MAKKSQVVKYAVPRADMPPPLCTDRLCYASGIVGNLPDYYHFRLLAAGTAVRYRRTADDDFEEFEYFVYSALSLKVLEIGDFYTHGPIPTWVAGQTPHLVLIERKPRDTGLPDRETFRVYTTTRGLAYMAGARQPTGVPEKWYELEDAPLETYLDAVDECDRFDSESERAPAKAAIGRLFGKPPT